jgi:phosphoenolpyruvate-protein kinase (PTS system EI component)
MTGINLSFRGMPYVPGVAQGILQQGLQGDPSGRIVMLEAPPGPMPQLPAGIVMVDAAPISHAMIPLLDSDLPVVIVTRAQAAAMPAGRVVRLDGGNGRITLAEAALERQPHVVPAAPAADLPARTTDGTPVMLRVSVRDRHAAQRAVALGAEAIGLVRSEFLEPADGGQPDAAFYRAAFGGLCEAAGGRPVTIRLIDIAADKCPAWLPASSGAGGALGRQGVRLYGEEPLASLYRAQLEAIAALADGCRLSVLLPYVSDAGELEHWLGVLRGALPLGIPLGAMAETPAAVLQLCAWCELADFVAVGCNDLMQCLFGADRDRPGLRRYLDPYAPVLYRFLGDVAGQAGRERLERVQLCGVLPQLPGVLPVLIGLGFRAFSVEPARLPWLAETVANTRLADAGALASRVCRADSSAGVRALLQEDGPAPADLAGGCA